MSRWELFLLHASTLAIAISGVVYGFMKYAMTGSDPDSPLGHPWQPGVLKAHVLAAPFLVFAFGLVARGHALPKWRSGEKIGRRSGISLLGLVAPLVLSGYAVQAFTGDSLRRGTGWAHAALGAIYVLAYAAHLLKRVPEEGLGNARTAMRFKAVARSVSARPPASSSPAGPRSGRESP